MGFERLCRVVQNKNSNYDIDIFAPIIKEIEKITNLKYNEDAKISIAMRVIADHLRTVSFSIADGQLPENEKAGYVIRRILRRALRYGFTFLNQKQPFIYKLFPVLIEVLGEAYPELIKQQNIIKNVILNEEESFLRTLETGIATLERVIEQTKKSGYQIVSGKTAFELYDSAGFPLDLTELILKENGLIINKREYDAEMLKQKTRSKNAAQVETQDWTILLEDDIEEFIGYDYTETKLKITRYRKVSQKKKDLYHLVFNYTPFYAESGGQIGDTGYIQSDTEKIKIIDTKIEHNVIIHYSTELPKNLTTTFKAVVNSERRQLTACNHSSTHLLHNTLRKIIGEHIEQKGSFVDNKHLRFDFSHFQKLTEEDLSKVEAEVNKQIRQNIQLIERRDIPMSVAEEMGALALFGEKYGDLVRAIKFGDSVELCGGIHVKATGEIGYFKITSERAVAAGIRRIEAITSVESEKYINSKMKIVEQIQQIFKASKNIVVSVEKLVTDNKSFCKQIDVFNKIQLSSIKEELKTKLENINGINVIAQKIEIDSADLIKQLAFELKGEINNLFLVIGANVNGKAIIAIMISNNLIDEKGLNANTIIRKISKEIQGGGGGQPFFATAGGKNINGIDKAIKMAVESL